MTTLVEVIFVGSLDAGSTPATSTNRKSGTVRRSPKALEKSRAFSFSLSNEIRFGMLKSVNYGGR